MTVSAETIRSNEQQGLSLRPGEAMMFNPEMRYGDQPAVVAVISTDAEGLGESADHAPDKLVLIDMRAVPDGHDGMRPLGDALFTAKAPYILIDPKSFNPQQDTGYKALRSGETFLFGRPSDQLPADDKRRRFIGLSDMTSRSHFQISIGEDDSVSIADVGSTNGTNVLTRPMIETVVEKQPIIPAQKLGNLATREQATVSKEFEIGSSKFNIVGKVPTGRYGDVYVVASQDAQGENRQFMVYRSQSEGNLRASQGIDGRHFIKGPEYSDHVQYTQDTKLHPDFEAKLRVLTEEQNDGGVRQLGEDVITMSAAAADTATRDFESQVETYLFADHDVANLLKKGRAGELGRSDIEFDFGTPQKFLDYIRDLNEVIVKSGILPDFTRQAETVRSSQHPLLGNITTEVFLKDGIEWHMASDTKGRVWVDRVRMQDAEPTAYGTDKQMIYSGILTSKPLDYKHQTSGIPAYLRSSFNNRYDDISPFLAQLAPIQQYQSARRKR